MSAARNTHPKRCDGHSVGVIITDPVLGVLIGDISDGRGASGVGGHVEDDFDGFDQAAHGEVNEETGLTVTSLNPLFPEPKWRANPCKRGDGPFGLGHKWQLYRATVADVKALRLDRKSFRNLRWVSEAQLQELAERTLRYARGEITRGEWEERPGLTFSWVLWFVLAGMIEMPEAELQEIEDAMLNDTSNRP
ncbi:NUDIX hydrolase [Actinomadura sp. NPDC048021]|uniref:NUDIX hydrolase n=1 Tax=Actinomadura sp. NPDC048021 TaxID=3155385 RepID=UPI0033E3DD3F